MKSSAIRREADALARREVSLRRRFLDPIWNISSWNPHATDFAAAYVGLLHAEAEACLERVVGLLLEHARAKSEKFKPDDVLLNCCAFYREELHARFSKLEISPSRSELAKNSASLLRTWDSLGAAKYFGNRVADSHGAGVKYVENLFHPLGLVISEKPFASRYGSKGVKRLAALGSSQVTLLTEFVVLRGSAMHSGAASFELTIRTDTPPAIAARGSAVTLFVRDLTTIVANRMW